MNDTPKWKSRRAVDPADGSAAGLTGWGWENDEENAGDNWLIVDYDSDNHDVVAIVPKTGDEQYDNDVVYPRARMIAAVEELFEALLNAAGQLDMANRLLGVKPEARWFLDYRDAARAALAKARGR